MRNIMFKPWKGTDYGKTQYGKLLIVGESHYDYRDVTDLSNFTKNTLQRMLKERQDVNPFYVKIGEIFNPNDHLEIWSKVAFANAIQHLYPEPRGRITTQQLETVIPALQEYLELTKPAKMIVFSAKVWELGIPDNSPWGDFIETLSDNENKKKGTVLRFKYEGGQCYAIGLHHPSSWNPPFKPEEWRPLVMKFLNKDYAA